METSKDRFVMETGVISPSRKKLSSKRAQAWIQEEFDGWHCLGLALTEFGEVDAAASVSHSVSWMMEACNDAMTNDRRIRVESEFDFRRLDSLKSGFRVLRAAVEWFPRMEQYQRDAVAAPLAQLVDSLASTVQAAVDANDRRVEELEARRAERLTPERLVELETSAESIRFERDATLAAVAKPWVEKLDAIEEEADELRQLETEAFMRTLGEQIHCGGEA